MERKRFALASLVLALSILACGLRPGSVPEATEIAKGIAEGIPTGRALLAAELTETAVVARTLTAVPLPTCKPGAFGCLRATAEPYIEGALGTPTPAPVLPPVLFTVVTKGQSNVTGNFLYDQAGVPNRLGSGTRLIQLMVRLAGGVELPVHETYLVNEYYMVRIEAWVELLDLQDQGKGAYDRFLCAWHDEKHIADPITEKPQVLCHAHLYNEKVIAQENVIGVVERDVFVEILEVDQDARMARISLSRLWIDADLVSDK